MSQAPESHNLEELLAGYVLGNLDEEELVWLHQQLEANPQLNEQVRQLQETLTLMPYGLPSQAPRVALKSQIIATAQLSPPKYRPRLQQYLRFNHLGWIAGAIAMLVALGLGLDGYRLRQQLAQIQLQQQQESLALLRQPNNRLMTLKGVRETPQTSGSLLIVPQQKKAVLVLQNVTPLTEGNVYRLWAVSQGKKIGCTDFVPDENGMVYLELSQNNLTKANSVAITIEPQPNTEKPTGITVIEGIKSL